MTLSWLSGRLHGFVMAAIVGFAAPTCAGDDEAWLEPVKGCRTDDACVAADPRYDFCYWVCSGQTTYCGVSCETDADCRGRGLPSDHVYCDIPREGEGFCNEFNFGYAAGQCDDDVPPLPGEPPEDEEEQTGAPEG